MRGLPGSGKSTWIKNNCPNAFVCSADNYFFHNGVYRYDADKIHIAHNACMNLFLDCVLAPYLRYDALCIDNTNCQAWEIAPYYTVAEARGYDVEIVWLQCYVRVATERNIHNVSEETIRKMSMKMEREQLPQWWKRNTIIVNGSF